MSGPQEVTLRHGAATDVGRVREANEDALLTSPPLYAVADGMGGHDRGDVASALVVQELALIVERDELGRGTTAAAAAAALVGALVSAQEQLAAYEAAQRAAGAERFSSGTTVVAAVLVEHEDAPAWLVVNLGDSRAYRCGAQQLSQVTTDHSLVQQLVEAGTVVREHVRHHPERHVITRALGGSGGVDPDFVVLPLGDAPRLLLCSDGISDLLDDTRIGELLQGAATPQDAADALVAAALSAGGTDNATAVVVDLVDRAAPDPHGPAPT